MIQSVDGTLWVVWDSYRSGNWDIWFKTSSDNGVTWSAESQWTRFLHDDSAPALAALSDGSVAVAWSSDRSGIFDIWFGIFGEREDVSPPPYIYSAEHLPAPNPDSDDTVTVRAEVVDETAVQSVYLVWTRDGAPQTDLPMYDDGTRNDGSAGDGWYGAQIGPLPAGEEIGYQIRAVDSDANSVTAPGGSFTVLEPFSKTADILFVNEGSSLGTYYAQAFDDDGWIYDLWDAALRGAVPSSILAQYTGGAVVWAVPYSGYATSDSAQQAALGAYLDGGGRLFITGQELAYYGGPLLSYLHAQYVQDNAGLFAVNGEASDPIGDGLALGISGGDGANNQDFPDEVDPIAPAVTVLRYDSEALTSLATLVQLPPADRRGGGDRDLVAGGLAEPRDAHLRRADDPALVSTPCIECKTETKQAPGPEDSVQTAGVISSGTAALRVDTGTYKLVYFAFGFEAINSRADRAEVMERVLSWLGGVLPRPTKLAPANAIAVPVGDVVFSWRSVPGAGGYELQIDRTAAFSSPEVTSVTTSATSHTATLTPGIWYWRVRAAPDGAWTGAWQVLAAGPLVQVTTDLAGDYRPSMAQDAGGKLWVVWHSYRSGNADVWFKTSNDGGSTWSTDTQLTTDASHDYSPRILRAADGTLWVVWASTRAGNSGIWFKTSSDGGSTWSGDTQLTGYLDQNYAPAITQAADGTLWVVWYSDRSGNYDLWFKTSSDSGSTWSAETQLTSAAFDDRTPAITQAADGTLWVVWDSDRDDTQLWYKTSSDGGSTWSADARVTTNSASEYSPAIMHSSDGMLWLMWSRSSSYGSQLWYQTSSDSPASNSGRDS